ncbi:MAG: molecular chaperone HtpG [Alphaproteobacteria bacterium]|nr:molecular chaperone HtpG [Alphaproteobacteria bacterium]|tara:strand:- start:951 stop:2873 length:1923 start_codon:yes stop_codon:yes gene_type:complete
MSDKQKIQSDSKKQSSKPEKHKFEAEVGKLLDLMINSLYQDKEIFLRELISNASDACDKARYKALTDPNLLDKDTELNVTITTDKAAGILTITDNGIGMSREELIDNLGTIAKSGTESFVANLKNQKKEEPQLIGRFGVGFYSAFMVANKVEVITRHAESSEGYKWVSDGKGAFNIEPFPDAKRGAKIILHLRKAEKEFLDPFRIKEIIKSYSDHIDIPVNFNEEGNVPEIINKASAIWTRSKTEISDESYVDFYKNISHSTAEPWRTIHMHAEGKIEYTALLYVPDTPPFDLFDVKRQHKVKLYVRKVFISDDCEGLIPAWLRFLRGVVDSSDLPLNISRETLQHNPILSKIKNGLTKRVLAELKTAAKDKSAYEDFWRNFGAVLKEGIYEDPINKDKIIELAMFRSTLDTDVWVSLSDYISRMPEKQSSIYYLSAENELTARSSPHLEGFKARGIEVLIMTDPVDQFWLPVVGTWNDKKFQSVTQGNMDLSEFELQDKTSSSDIKNESQGEVDKLIAVVKLTLGDSVKDVRSSERLTDSPVCLIADTGDVDIHLERLLQIHKQPVEEQQRVLEINPRHDMIQGLAAMVSEEGSSDILTDAAHLLFDQAKILEGQALGDPVAFTRRLSSILSIGLLKKT